MTLAVVWWHDRPRVTASVRDDKVPNDLLQPYLSGLNSVHKNLGYDEPALTDRGVRRRRHRRRGRRGAGRGAQAPVAPAAPTPAEAEAVEPAELITVWMKHAQIDTDWSESG